MRQVIKLFHWIRKRTNKYLVAFIVFFVVTFCVGDSNLYNRYLYNKKIDELAYKIAQLRREKEENAEKLEALFSDNESLERFAREQYQMCKPDEEIFIIRDF